MHNRHVCAVLKCEHAPYKEVQKLIDKAEYCINPFPVLVKARSGEIDKIIEEDSLLKNRIYKRQNVKIIDLYEQADNKLVYGKSEESGYPITKIKLAIAYLIAAKTGQLNGSRPKGRKDTIIKNYLEDYPDGEVLMLLPEILTPMIIRMGAYATLIGPSNPKVYKKLIQICPENQYKIKIRKITEDDLK